MQPPPYAQQPQPMQPPQPPMQPPQTTAVTPTTPPQAPQGAPPPAAPTTQPADPYAQAAPPPPPPPPYAQQPYTPYAQPYAPYPQYAQPYAVPPGPPPPSHLHDGEVIGNFATVGILAATDILVRQDIENGNAVTFILLAGAAGGGGAGYVLTQKFPIDAGVAHSTTIGTLIGVANGALLIEPLGYDHASSVMGLLLAGSALGAAGGFIYGEAAHLTPGQSVFVGNLALIGSATAALTAVTANRDGHYGGFEDGTLALGLDGGALAGALIAPHLDWSPRRAKYVFATTFVGALVGGLLGGLLTTPSNGGASDANATATAAAMTAGLWGGFGLGILMTKNSAPDPSLAQPAAQPQTAAAPTTSMLPWMGDHGQMGMMMGGTF